MRTLIKEMWRQVVASFWAASDPLGTPHDLRAAKSKHADDRASLLRSRDAWLHGREASRREVGHDRRD